MKTLIMFITASFVAGAESTLFIHAGQLALAGIVIAGLGLAVGYLAAGATQPPVNTRDLGDTVSLRIPEVY